MRRLVRLRWAGITAAEPSGHVATTGESSVSSALLRRLSGAAASAKAAADAAPGWSPAAAVMFLPSAVCGYLAYWQYERMRWKEGLITDRERMADAPPLDLMAPDYEPKDYDKVFVRGRYLDEYSVYVGPRPRSVPGQGIQSGYLVVSPLRTEDKKGVALVNRGWAPAAWKEAHAAEGARVLAARQAQRQAAEAAAAAEASSSQPAAAKSGGGWFGWGRSPAPAQPPAASQPPPSPVVDVVGVVQPDEASNQFMPGNREEEDEFHSLQRGALARAMGLPHDTPLVTLVTTAASASVPTQPTSPLQQSRGLDPSGPGPDGPDEGPSYPQPKHSADLVRFTTMPIDHRNYALIWGSLCVLLAGMARQVVTSPSRGLRMVQGSGETAREAWSSSRASEQRA
ncbi:hypothetical protein HYH03_008326 [Edaphochlamys debaryana]|uniref:SURF1-like protein n=1 Tax=Edaphochlamys debaryana TaxID=47281 RepID=A0A836BYE5_9CHLO|nr:hypothetical protein HYH03_008326 [Edaphochlamys debaryana]|eukprot:KAG2493510.1 hypothetical protein HYH03_008326 [Edaphochlamys debaryana]